MSDKKKKRILGYFDISNDKDMPIIIPLVFNGDKPTYHELEQLLQEFVDADYVDEYSANEYGILECRYCHEAIDYETPHEDDCTYMRAKKLLASQ